MYHSRHSVPSFEIRMTPPALNFCYMRNTKMYIFFPSVILRMNRVHAGICVVIKRIDVCKVYLWVCGV